MSKAVFTMKLEPELRDSFMAAVAAADRPASQVVRELMRDYIEQRSQAHEYAEFLRRKVDAGRADFRAGRTFTNDEVAAKFAARRAATRRDLQTSGS
ncbi:MAG: antitoxin of toxin-antitoxin stability system [Pseudomonadales bacterium]|nr:antitoxin of toxin-antitoxin stability system [Pseudomonadales bacterium]